ncbi:putative secreted protein [Pimelobacter simplex]|uniref:Putative secreted protein n=2 Tax=Nocardioides simplex TaxID=2045 RepID=A0A0C5XBT1_NOCSI|nr:putative secreted protein [Pimelobacter simplex]GEB12639.1 hypothetical protein NSI01_09540 [Pimelobacter simplex]SFM56566.1 Uncharacterized conserved protein, contains LGFP repeats [Pimelobacter simplex]
MVMSFSDSSFRRRDLAGLAAAVAAVPVVALATGAGPASAAGAAAPVTAGPRVRLRAEDADDVVSAVDIPLAVGAGGLARAAGPVRTAALDTDRFAMLGVTWHDGRGAAQVRVRVRAVGGGWGAWRRLSELHDRPNAASAEARATPSATEPLWVGPSDGVQVEVAGAMVQPVLTLIDPGRRAGDSTLTPAVAPVRDEPAVAGRAVPKKKAPNRQPAFYTRAQWGADPRWASGTPVQVRTIKQVHVHHTATANDYAAADVPAILRGIYRYHTKSLGWSDVGYNFFVDRFGRIWAGRRRPKGQTQGAHTLGFNHVSVGIAVLGNHDAAAPSDAVIAGVTRVAAWKLAKYHRNAAGTIRVTSRGSDKYRKGRKVVLPVIDGHRDTNDTACPGRYLYAELPRIRARTARRMRRFNT